MTGGWTGCDSQEGHHCAVEGINVTVGEAVTKGMGLSIKLNIFGLTPLVCLPGFLCVLIARHIMQKEE